MSQITVEGVVKLGDECRVAYVGEGLDGAVHIGATDFQIWATEFLKDKQGKVFLAIASDFLIGDTSFEGIAKLQMGWGYSEYTPMDADEFFIGPHDILAILKGLEGKSVTVWLGDSPLNILQEAKIT